MRVFVFQVSKDLSFHLNNLRAINKNRKHYSDHANNISVHIFLTTLNNQKLRKDLKKFSK